MGKRGPKPQGKVNIKWSTDFAYALGLLASDGSLSKDGRHVVLVSTDLDQIENFRSALRLTQKISVHGSFDAIRKKAFRVQIGDVLFYEFLLTIGFTPNKSQTIGRLKIPPEYFFDFLRGSFDGDGSFYSYWDKRWKSSFLFYTSFVSASMEHIKWLRNEVFVRLGINGHISHAEETSCYQLKYAKKDSIILTGAMYYSDNILCLSRKRLKISKALAILTKPR